MISPLTEDLSLRLRVGPQHHNWQICQGRTYIYNSVWSRAQMRCELITPVLNLRIPPCVLHPCPDAIHA